MSANIRHLQGCLDHHNKKDFDSKYTRRTSRFGWMTVINKFEDLESWELEERVKQQKKKGNAEARKQQSEVVPNVLWRTHRQAPIWTTAA
jgi:hypothetical protein